MSLISHKPVRIGRGQRELRDDRVFVVATEDTYAPEHYFKGLPMPRVKVLVLPTDSGLSSPEHVVLRLKEAFEHVTKQKQVQQGDEFWVLLDADHHTEGTHLKNLLKALLQARQSGFEVAISSPCFELWLLLHHADVPPGTVFTQCKEVAAKLAEVLGGYDKTAIQEGRFKLAHLPDAIRRARALEENPDAPEGLWPKTVGTRVYRLFESALGGRGI